MSTSRIANFLALQHAIDMGKDFSNKRFAKSPASYLKDWKAFVSETEANVKQFKTELDYYESIAEELKAKADPNLPKRNTLGSARTHISNARSKLRKQSPDQIYPHFFKELEHLKVAHRDYLKHFEQLDTSTPEKFDESIGLLVVHGVPKDITQKLNLLPFRHPALNTLKLTHKQYAELTALAKKNKGLSHENAPVAHISKVQDFVLQVYRDKDKDPNDYIKPFIALEFALGRRSVELGFLTEISESKIAGHLNFKGFAKQGKKVTTLDLPVVILKAHQALELFHIARERTKRVLFGKRPEVLLEISKTKDTKGFSNLFKKVRADFKKYFKFERLKNSPTLKADATMHNAARSIYKFLALKEFADHPRYKHLSPIAMANLILAHEKGDFDTTLAYFDMNIIDDTEKRKTSRTENSKSETPKAKKKAVSKPVHTEPQISKEDKNFLRKVRNVHLMRTAAEFAKKKRIPAITKIHLAMLVQFKRKPTTAQLNEIAGEKAAKAYINFLVQNKIQF